MNDRYQVVPRRLATQDLRDAAAHYAAEADAATAHRFIDAAEQVITLINRRPVIGSPAASARNSSRPTVVRKQP